MNQSPNENITSPYIGRFAPSPSGKLHFGSLVAALASYLDARSCHGQWLVRMEDLDPPREEPGAADNILRSLEAHHLFWDSDILYQSNRHEAYEAALDELGSSYPCDCSRQRIAKLSGCYDGHCATSPPTTTACAIRLRTDRLSTSKQREAETFEDLFLGRQQFPLSSTGDIIIKRKDGLFAYQLAVAVDDRYQGISHVIRGHDLIDSTSRQRYILSMLNKPKEGLPVHPFYGHSPLALSGYGNKLSKQNKANPINNDTAPRNLLAALSFLNHSPPDSVRDTKNCDTLLKWAAAAWERNKVPTQAALAPSLTDE